MLSVIEYFAVIQGHLRRHSVIRIYTFELGTLFRFKLCRIIGQGKTYAMNF